MKSGNNYYGDLIVTTTFSIDHPNYIGKHIDRMRAGSITILVICIIVTIILTIADPHLLMIGIPITFASLIWTYYTDTRIKNINRDMENELLEVEGIVKKDGTAVSVGHYPYPGGYVILENTDNKFKADTTFIRRINKGQKVRLLYTPNLKYIKAWQLIV